MNKIDVVDREWSLGTYKEIVINEPVGFDDIYDMTTELLIKRYPKTEDLLEALGDQVYDDICMEFREYLVEIAKDCGKYKED